MKNSFEGNKNIREELVAAVKKSGRFEKCVKYIMEKCYKNDSDNAQMRKRIVDEYEEFIGGLYDSLYQHRVLLAEQFQKGNA